MLRYLVFVTYCMLYSASMVIEKPGPRYPPTKGEVWPKPQQEIKESNYYTFNPSQFKIKITDQTCDILTNAVERYSYIVRSRNGVQYRDERVDNKRRRRIPGEGERSYRGGLLELQVDLTAPCDREHYPHFDMDESYNLTVSTTSVLKSGSVWGIIRGLETFAQSFYLDEDMNEILINATLIVDFPRYTHRGLLLDTSRHYISLNNILKTLDAMTINKMNVFHWHIVDDQSFPYQSEKFPDLSAQGAYHSSMVYTKEDIQRVVLYARDRGIRVIPEFDVPGHTRSWGNAYPNVLTECYDARREVIGLGPMNPIRNATYKLLRDLFREVQGRFPDKYFHVGGDEVELDCWKSNPELQEYMKQHNLTASELHALFMRNTMPLLAHNSNAIVWQEVFDEGVQLSKDTLVQVWKYNWISEMVQVLTTGHRVLFSSSWYLDHLGNEWKDYYAADPRQMVYDVTNNATLAAGIVGGEACMWAEMMDDRNVISRVWPRASAVAERLWSAGVGSTRTLFFSIPDETYSRLEEHTCRMIRRGIDAQPPSGPGYCLA